MAAPSHLEVIAWWPSQAEFARSIGATPVNVKMMVKRGYIPAHRFDSVLEAVRSAGFPPLTYAQLTDGLPSRKKAND